ncbi:hypothetical protein [Phreatobacter stygius]|uniref:Uncharacterized protein n=1 Tax=Phreatobacter stygius TaxID=1940610 RepID=A0A4D7AVC9_9HYPH|nr:hypothetical protein [Phreatobacter stygius]QCI63701.1 hypothetical protein E8M01_05270 [Phreatobacter stygius]
MLPAFSDTRREPTRPAAYRDAEFDAKYDAETLFYDAFRDADTRIVLVGPPFLNLQPALAVMTLTARPSGVACRFEIRELDRHGQIHVEAPDGTTSLTLSAAFGTTEITVNPSEVDLFAGRRVMFTQSKNNHLAWIQDWVRFSRDIHGADAVLIYDNGSTDYSLRALAEAIGALDGIAVARIVSWPFKFGPQGLDAKRFWDSDYGQHGVWEHGRRRFLAAAASVQCSDVDEMILSIDGRSIFEAAESARFGVCRYYGRWVLGIEGREPAPDKPGKRHRDYRIVRRERPQRRLGLITIDGDRCPPKWTIVPSKCPPDAQWRIHVIGGHAASRLTTRQFSYRHFREISDSWKYARTGREAFDPTRHEEDPLLADHLARVRWDV